MDDTEDTPTREIVPQPEAQRIPPAPPVEAAMDTDSLVAEVAAPVNNALAPATAPAPVPEQRSSHVNVSKLASEKVVVAAPLSFAGSAARIWKLTGITSQAPARVGLGVLAILLILVAWVIVLAWYLVWGIFLVPYRLIRRGSRKRKREALQHREQLAAIEAISKQRD